MADKRGKSESSKRNLIPYSSENQPENRSETRSKVGVYTKTLKKMVANLMGSGSIKAQYSITDENGETVTRRVNIEANAEDITRANRRNIMELALILRIEHFIKNPKDFKAFEHLMLLWNTKGESDRELFQIYDVGRDGLETTAIQTEAAMLSVAKDLGNLIMKEHNEHEANVLKGLEGSKQKHHE